MEKGGKVVFFIISLTLSILIILSQNLWTQGECIREIFDWSTYTAPLSTCPGNIVNVCWQNSFIGQMFPFTAYFPAIAGVVGLLSSFLIFKSESAIKTLLKITGILAILGFGLYILSNVIWVVFGNPDMLLPNLPGGYFCLIPGIMLFIMGIVVKKPDYMKGHAREDKDYYAIGGEAQGSVLPATRAPMVKCPHCNAMIQADQTFCENCGEFL